MYTVEQIHADFYSAEQRLLDEAKAIIGRPVKDMKDRAERMRKLGFGSTETVRKNNDVEFEKAQANALVADIAYFHTHYPHNKFITEEEVKRLCGKYSLVLGGADRYIGDIPEKNLRELESFKLRKDDYLSKTSINFDLGSFTQRWLQEMSWGMRSSSDLIGFGMGNREFVRESDTIESLSRSAGASATSEAKPYFEICAPASDFRTSGMVLSDGYKLEQAPVPDPIVLQPVRGGYLIVTAWGPEASDEIVVNQKMN
jgi:hypothetical protein